MTAPTSLPLALTIGDPAGIGPEIAVKAWQARREADVPAFVLLGDPEILSQRAHEAGLGDMATRVLAREDAASVCAIFDTALPVVALGAFPKPVAGKPDPAFAPLVTGAIETAVTMVRDGSASAVVTNPINKEMLYGAGFSFPGHTEYLGELARELFGVTAHPVMMLAGEDLRVVPVTVHIALREVPEQLTTDLIVETGRIVARDLIGRLGIARPRIAIAGLNPHAGEGGAMGTEEITIIAPAIEALRAAGLDVRGPLPADTMFHPRARAGYDAAICMYHDQALIPIKTIAFDTGVNTTLGLPFVRTSPDHGTAYDIAGTGKAEASSLIAALKLAARMGAHEAAAEADA